MFGLVPTLAGRAVLPQFSSPKLAETDKASLNPAQHPSLPLAI